MIVTIVSPKLPNLEFMETVSENRENFMTKKPEKVVKKRKGYYTNIHSINNQEFRFPSLIQRVKELWSKLF